MNPSGLPRLLLTGALLSCGSAAGDDAFSDDLAEQALNDYAHLVRLNYADTVSGAEALRDAVTDFVSKPSPASQAAAKQAWIDARAPYGPSEAFRFYDGPIDDPETGPEGRINGWPLDESYIDYTRDEP